MFHKCFERLVFFAFSYKSDFISFSIFVFVFQRPDLCQLAGRDPHQDSRRLGRGSSYLLLGELSKSGKKQGSILDLVALPLFI